MLELNTLYNMDCMDGMKQFPDKYFELCLTDFPYGINENYSNYIDSEENLKFLIKNVIPELKRISNVVAITTGVKNLFLYPQPDWILNWYCPAGTGCGPWGFCTWQPIVVYGSDPYLAKGLGSRPDSINYTGNSNVKFHPCAKPIGLWRRLLRRVTIKPCNVFDPMSGSGTTAITCILEGYNWVCFEKDTDYYNAALERIKRETAQYRMDI